MLRLLGLNRINFLVKRSLVLLTLLGSVFITFNSPTSVHAEEPYGASLTVTGNFDLDLTPQGTEQVVLRATGFLPQLRLIVLQGIPYTCLAEIVMVILPTLKHQMPF